MQGAKGEIKGLKVSPTKLLSHLLFVDDIIMLGASSKTEFQGLKTHFGPLFLGKWYGNQLD
jgi:hypothetical protein